MGCLQATVHTDTYIRQCNAEHVSYKGLYISTQYILNAYSTFHTIVSTKPNTITCVGSINIQKIVSTNECLHSLSVKFNSPLKHFFQFSQFSELKLQFKFEPTVLNLQL